MKNIIYLFLIVFSGLVFSSDKPPSLAGISLNMSVEEARIITGCDFNDLSYYRHGIYTDICKLNTNIPRNYETIEIKYIKSNNKITSLRYFKKLFGPIDPEVYLQELKNKFGNTYKRVTDNYYGFEYDWKFPNSYVSATLKLDSNYSDLEVKLSDYELENETREKYKAKEIEEESKKREAEILKNKSLNSTNF